ncbi:MAG TPA: SNF2-related protein [Polyangiaceae bacterium]|nr:SNF2-related protein [Polyangiaceae bacterium]
MRASFEEDVAEQYTMAHAKPIAVEARLSDDLRALLGECSRCLVAFGPCVHIATLAVDLASSGPLRGALLGAEGTMDHAERARARRLAFAAELEFGRALRVWIGPTSAKRAVEIAASPWEDAGPKARSYGDFTDPGGVRAIAIFVRRAGERRLLSPIEASTLHDFEGKDRHVLEYAANRGVGRKAVYASGVHASLALEAMRTHGGVFANGYKSLLDFRSTRVRPSVSFRRGAPGSMDALTTHWVTDDLAFSIPFQESIFFAGPFPFVWSKDGAIFPVAPDVDLALTHQLATAPVLFVPPGKLKQAGSELLRSARGRGFSLPPPETFGLPPVETPRIVLRLSGEPLAVDAELVAAYRKREIALALPAGEAKEDERGRDLETEAMATGAVARAGFNLDATDDGTPRLVVHGEGAIAFWSEGLAELRASRTPTFEIELTKRLARIRVGAPVTSRLRVGLEGDWLKMRLDFASKELPVELAEVRAALDRKQRWVALGDGTLAKISESIETIATEASELMAGRSEARLPFHQLGRLDRWIEEHDGKVDDAVVALRRRLRSLAVATKPKMPRGLRATLRPYQKLGLSWLQFIGALGAGGILADDMGLGKTIMTLAYLLRRKQDEGPAPSLVVCPTSVVGNWITEARRFTPRLRVQLLYGPSRPSRLPEALARPEALADGDVWLTTYALLRRDAKALASVRFRCVVLDEAQNIKNADSQTRRAAERLDASTRLALSGTPVENRLHELWSIASFVNPGMLGTSRAFEKHFEGPIVADRTSPRAAELRSLLRPFLLRRTKDDVLRDLPPKTEVDRLVTLTPEGKRMYDAMAHTLRASLTQSTEKRRLASRSLSVFTALTRLRQMACDPGLLEPRLWTSRSAKREAFLELVRELVAEGRRALVFSQFVQLLTLWRKDLDAEGIAYEYLDGSTTRRDEVVTRFQEGKAPLFLISLKAGGAGLNLTAADTVIHCDPWWNPAVEDQATDRAYRIGQDKPVTVVRLVAQGTIEEKIISLKAKKRELADVIVRNDAGALEGITDEDLRLLLGDADVATG